MCKSSTCSCALAYVDRHGKAPRSQDGDSGSPWGVPGEISAESFLLPRSIGHTCWTHVGDFAGPGSPTCWFWESSGVLGGTSAEAFFVSLKHSVNMLSLPKVMILDVAWRSLEGPPLTFWAFSSFLWVLFRHVNLLFAIFGFFREVLNKSTTVPLFLWETFQKKQNALRVHVFVMFVCSCKGISNFFGIVRNCNNDVAC